VIRALCWKEYRVHRLSWLLAAGITLAALGGLAVRFPWIWPAATEAGSLADAAAWLALGITSFYGLICGTLMLAGVREARVREYLDFLAGRRLPQWALKAILAVVFTFAQGALLGGLAVLIGWLEGRRAPTLPLALLPLLALDGLAWGLAASVITRRSALALVLGIVLQAGAWGVALGLGWLIAVHFIAVRVVLAGGALIFSCLVFCRPDLRRAAAAFGAVHVMSSAAQHGWFEAAAVALFALLLPRADPALWPLGVWLVAVVFGVLAFAGEQKDGKARFLGEHWLPLHRAWLIRTVGALLGAVITSAVVLLAALRVDQRVASLQSYLRSFRDDSTVAVESALPGIGPWPILALLLVSGFSAGQFGGALIGRRHLAILVGCLLSGALIALFLPSLMLGGQAIWPLLVLPVFLLTAVVLVVWGKANGHTQTRRYVAGCCLLCALWVSGILWYRVAEIPNVEPFDRPAFEAMLLPNQQDAGALLREVSEELQRKRPPDEWAGWMLLFLPDALHPGDLESWWGKTAADDEWMKGLDALFASEVAGRVRRAAHMPPGVFRDAEALERGERCPELDRVPWLGSLFLTRASQLQARGQHAESLDHLAVILGLARQLRHKTPLHHLEAGESLEWKALAAFELWLRQIGPRADLWRRAAEVLQRHEELQPRLSDNWRAEYYGFREAVSKFIDAHNWRHGWMCRLARAMPWERAREQRQINLLFAERITLLDRPYCEAFPPPQLGRPTVRADSHEERLQPLPPTVRRTIWWPLAGDVVVRRDVADSRAYSLTLLRGARLQTALARYAVENGKQAATLSALVPRYLPALPPDPFSGRTFGYRISSGDQFAREQIRHNYRSYLASWTQTIPAGQGLVWSTGPDQVDHGGKRQGRDYRVWDTLIWATNQMDLVFEVPYVSKK
jgi:hypothetical protein